MKIPTTYDSSLPLREKILYVLSVLKKESVGELSAEITELDAVTSEEGVAQMTVDVEDEINRMVAEGVVTRVKEHRQKIRFVLRVDKEQE